MQVIRATLLLVLGLLLVSVGVTVFLVTQPFVRAMQPTGVQRSVDPARLESHVRTIALDFAPRDHAHPENLDRVAGYVIERMRAAGGRVTEQTYKPIRATYRNVIASFGPDGGERIVVGAHYDSAEGFPAADDNASGVAGLIELAGLLGETRTLPLRVDLVAFAIEEPPFYKTSAMGSWVHAASLRQRGVRVRAMLSLEMIGYFSDEPGSQELPHPALALLYSSRGNFVAVVGRVGDGALARRVKSAMRSASDLPVFSMNAPVWIPGIDFSDHRSYWAHGYPAVMVSDTAFYRNQRYHTPRDTPDTLDYAKMAKVVRAVYQAVLALST